MGGHPDDNMGTRIDTHAREKFRTGHQSEVYFSPVVSKFIADKYEAALKAADITYRRVPEGSSFRFHFNEKTQEAQTTLARLRRTFTPDETPVQ